MNRFSAKVSTRISDEKCFIYDMAFNKFNDLIALNLSNFSIELMSAETLQNIATLKGHKNTITGIKFCSCNPNCLFSSSIDGSVQLWDIRNPSEKAAKKLEDSSEESVKPLLSFDFDISEKFICAGTELIVEDAFLLFWDIRKCQLLGGYWDSHSDDITQVKFHHVNKDCMASGSVDGLINIFDVSQSTEDDALRDTLNTESSVGVINWTGNSCLSCITHMDEFQIWDTENVTLLKTFTKEDLRNIDAEVSHIDYIVDVFQEEETIYLLTGSNSGSCHLWTINSKDLSYELSDILETSHETVRRLVWRKKSIITAYEDGTVLLWRPEEETLT